MNEEDQAIFRRIIQEELVQFTGRTAEMLLKIYGDVSLSVLTKLAIPPPPR